MPHWVLICTHSRAGRMYKKLWESMLCAHTSWSVTPWTHFGHSQQLGRSLFIRPSPWTCRHTHTHIMIKGIIWNYWCWGQINNKWYGLMRNRKNVLPWDRLDGQSVHSWNTPSVWVMCLHFPLDWALCRLHKRQTVEDRAGGDRYTMRTPVLWQRHDRIRWLTERHCRSTQVCFSFPGPPNFFISLQKLHSPHSGLMQASQRLHLQEEEIFPFNMPPC